MANPQPDQFTRLSNELYEAIMKTDFSKRQRNILDLIMRLSYGCRKKFAILRPSDFEVVGVLRGHIKKELDYLQMANVLHIEGEVYTINKDYDSWRVSISKAFNEEKYQKILSRNLQQNVTESVTKVTEMATDPSEDTVTKTVTNVTEMVTNVTEMVTVLSDENHEELPKQELHSYQNSNTPVTKTVTGTPFEPLQDAGSRVPKDSIKDSIKESSSTKILYLNQGTEKPQLPPQDFSYPRIYQIYEKHFASEGRVTEFEVEELGCLYDDYGGEWLYEAMREASRHKVLTLAYVSSVLKGFKKRGGPNKDSPLQPISKTNASPKEFVVDENDPILKRMREADALRLRGGGDLFAEQ